MSLGSVRHRLLAAIGLPFSATTRSRATAVNPMAREPNNVALNTTVMPSKTEACCSLLMVVPGLTANKQHSPINHAASGNQRA
jgi:hypothetical protein